MDMKNNWTSQPLSNKDFKVYAFVFATLFLQTSSSSSNKNDEIYVRLNNVTLPLKSFLHEYCSKEPCLEYQWCNESMPSFYCKRSEIDDTSCVQWCIGENGECSEVEECCGTDFECIHKICRSANLHIDFVVVVKVALATALIITIFAVFTLCWKGFIEPRCTSHNSQFTDDSVSINSERYARAHRSQDCSVISEKPPPYEECIQGCSSQEEPPPYSVAVIQIPTAALPDTPTRYVLSCSSEPTELSPRDIKLQETPVDSMNDMIISSPVTSMDDFVFLSTSDSSDSETSRTIHGTTKTGQNVLV